MAPDRTTVAWRRVWLIAVGFAAVLAVLGGRYGYHRDEVYFLAIGAHPMFGYVDQPPLVSLLDHGIDVLSGRSLLALRLAPALAEAAAVFVTGLLAREFGSTRGGQVLAAFSVAVSAILVDVAHIASTSIFDFLLWTLVTWLAVSALRDDGRVWLAVGAVAGIAHEVKTLPLFLYFCVLVGVLVVGPLALLRSRWLWAGAAIAVTTWLPNLIWQALHGFPQFTLSTAIARGGSGTITALANSAVRRSIAACPRCDDPLSTTQKTRFADLYGSRVITCSTSAVNDNMPVLFSHRPNTVALWLRSRVR